MKLDRIYIVGIIVFVIAVIGLTFTFPFRSLRQEALDSTMSSALGEVADEIKDYAQKNDKLPADLTALEFKSSYSVVNNNPGILGKITINVTDDKNFTKKFNLCADFKTEKESDQKISPLNDSFFSNSDMSSSYSSFSSVDYQTHPKGYFCFDDEKVYSSDYSGKKSLMDIYNNYDIETQDNFSSREETLNFN